MKILVILQYWFPYEGAIQPIYGAIFDDLLQKGHEITILTAFPHFRKGRKEEWREYRGRIYEKTKWHDATVVRTYVFAPRYRSNKLSMLFRAINFVSFYISASVAGLVLPRHDVVFVPSSPPLFGAICARLIGRIRKIPYIYNIQDLYPDIAVVSGHLKRAGLIRALEIAERSIYRHAKHLVVISETMKQAISKKGVSKSKITVIPNFCDTDVIKPISKRNKFSIKYGLHERFVVMFAGNIGMVQSTEYIIKSAELLQKYSDILFVFVGRGENKPKIEQLSINISLKNIKFIPQQPSSNMKNVWGSADVGLVTLKRGLSTYAVPSKTFGIMASGRPVLAMIDEGSEVWNMVTKAKGGLCIPPENPKLLTEAILRLFTNDEERKEMGYNARRYIVDNFHREIISKKYEDLFQNAVKKI